MRRALRDVTKTYLAGNTAARTGALAAVDDAYQSVGIT
jgi:hypothetical protein